MLLLIFLVLVTAGYLGLIASLIYGWKRLPDFNLKKLNAETGFTIIVPYRNEAENLPGLFKSLSGLHYPLDKFEIILVNDESQDQSKILCEEFQKNFPEMKVKILENIRRSVSPKKDAVYTAINSSDFDFIVTTDADCIVPPNWLRGFDQEIFEKGSKLIAGPVGFIQGAGKKKALFNSFEEMDFMSLQSTTVGSFGIEKQFMCNAANLCYDKNAFLNNSGFSENENIASGDDVFLLQKLNKKGLKLSFLKSEELIVLTRLQKNLSGLINQRLRWAAKASAYKSSFGRFTGIIVFLMNLLLILYAGLAFLEVISYQYVMLAFLLKFNADFILIYKAAKFFKRENLMRSYFWCSIVYPFFSVYVAGLSLFNGYEWKGRRFRK
ncbi:glycosyltransferase family 2 protein [Christiangramia crocea]|uniref:Glycosyltransferase n=1 Tax=Christiangramia crocea TaxID=2904124 RepID=A0A9X1UWH3_9FLAO|nr:glycosyltransferase [Gramella crocea]MCG9971645.1 glycosyltransferase [Gramella crocea]